jgi:hypothetical protein
LPTSIPNGAVTYYAGENYNSLPVRPGDHIRVVSRSVRTVVGLIVEI